MKHSNLKQNRAALAKFQQHQDQIDPITPMSMANDLISSTPDFHNLLAAPLLEGCSVNSIEAAESRETELNEALEKIMAHLQQVNSFKDNLIGLIAANKETKDRLLQEQERRRKEEMEEASRQVRLLREPSPFSNLDEEEVDREATNIEQRLQHQESQEKATQQHSSQDIIAQLRTGLKRGVGQPFSQIELNKIVKQVVSNYKKLEGKKHGLWTFPDKFLPGRIDKVIRKKARNTIKACLATTLQKFGLTLKQAEALKDKIT